ncbi:hypothetical protein RchiOBHm_Chr5g0023971 [Rosa chinensis]|uniref:Uncharacterized protein n=1 Tax=Rosa chinensis TaxID=74649 RepID=A0A2P6Q873_ROSCH|nr:hypothetical protein RchiOBHm_Chr5g0023971 [Rosa chinensis]
MAILAETRKKERERERRKKEREKEKERRKERKGDPSKPSTFWRNLKVLDGLS